MPTSTRGNKAVMDWRKLLNCSITLFHLLGTTWPELSVNCFPSKTTELAVVEYLGGTGIEKSPKHLPRRSPHTCDLLYTRAFDGHAHSDSRSSASSGRLSSHTQCLLGISRWVVPRHLHPTASLTELLMSPQAPSFPPSSTSGGDASTHPAP